MFVVFTCSVCMFCLSGYVCGVLEMTHSSAAYFFCARSSYVDAFNYFNKFAILLLLIFVLFVFAWPNTKMLIICNNLFSLFSPAAQFLFVFAWPGMNMLIICNNLFCSFFPAAQFFRCLWQTLNLKLNAEDEQAIINRYDIRRDGTINYRMFCDDINLNFNPKDLNKDPVEQKVDPPEL